MKLLTKCAALAAAMALSTSAFAHPIASVGTEGLAVIASGGAVVATYEGNSAGYSNDLLLGLFSLDVIFNNHASSVGSTVNLGSFTAGTELIFRLRVNNTGDI